MPIRVTPLSQALGAEISGVDLTTPLDPETVVAINQAWLEHLVIVIRGQQLSDEDQVRFAGYFGPIGDYLRPGALRSDAMKERHRCDVSAAQPITATLKSTTDNLYGATAHSATVSSISYSGTKIEYLTASQLPRRIVG